MTDRNKKIVFEFQVALFMGSFGFQPLLLKYAGKGGPLGELVQWTDTLCGLYVLGYDVNVYLNITDMGYVCFNYSVIFYPVDLWASFFA